MRLSSRSLGALALASTALAQNVTNCVSGGVCYAVSVPERTSADGVGNIFIQISGPKSLSWIGIGQGSSMSGANIFIIHANAAGDNVTLSPRLGLGERAPAFQSTAEVTLLEGSGIANGRMVANFRCSNCDSWNGGTMSFSDTDSNWIWAYQSGRPIASDSLQTQITQHSRQGRMTLNLRTATSLSTNNPFVGAVASASNSESHSSEGASSSESSKPSHFDTVMQAHGVLGSIAFIALYPAGAMILRLLSFRGVVLIHAGWQIFTSLIAVAVLGMGLWMAITDEYMTEAHSIIGILVIVSLLIQPVTGLLHHSLYKRRGSPNVATYPHVWWGRAMITLGIINGGLGLQLAGSSRGDKIAYSLFAGVMWLLWMIVILLSFFRGTTKETVKTIKDEPLARDSQGSHEQMRQSESYPQ